MNACARAALPKALSENRYDEDGAITEKIMVEQMKQLDRQIHDAAQPLDHGDQVVREVRPVLRRR